MHARCRRSLQGARDVVLPELLGLITHYHPHAQSDPLVRHKIGRTRGHERQTRQSPVAPLERNGSAGRHAVLAVAIAATGELFNHNGTLVQLRDGKLIPISSNELHELITRHVAAVRVVKRDGVWQREFYSYEFAQKPNFELPTSTNPRPRRRQ